MMSISERYSVQQEPLRSERRAELVLLGALLLLLLLSILGGYRVISPSLSAPIPPAPDSMVVADVTSAGAVTLEQRNEIQARPLFWSSRRPLEAAPVVVETPKEASKSTNSLKGVTLKGVFGGDEQAGIIVLSKGKKRRLWVGDELDGWTLDAVEPTEVRFADGPKVAVLTLKRGTLEAQPNGAGGNASDTAPAATLEDPATATKGKPAAGRQQGSGLGLGGGDRNRQGDKK